MLLVNAAEKIIFDLIPSLGDDDRETVDLLSSNGRILAAPVIGNYDIPPWTNSAMDGYAVHYEDVEHCSPQHPVVLRVIEEIPAGKIPQLAIERGEAARIYTGAMLPEGANAIVIQETTKLEVRPDPAPDPYQETSTPANLELDLEFDPKINPEINLDINLETNLETNPDQLLTAPPKPPASSYIWVLEAPNSREFVRHRGAFYQAGSDLLTPGLRIGAPEIAVLAAVQCTQVSVYRPLKVAILSTGDELVTPEQPLAPGQIVDSNQYALAALVQQAGAVPILMGIVPDQPDLLRERSLEPSLRQILSYRRGEFLRGIMIMSIDFWRN
ncbi:MAG: molybdopterin molybdotransferase MoeA [Coleofasciculaceae cyanobacterium SM2_1_6]|nr:molybdopterin molybdotransferase MoeA [Coleofasciculaceae cyanobacterium SM2_1_6]